MAATITSPRRSRVLGVPVNIEPDCLAAALALHRRGGGQVVTLNAEMTMAALADRALGSVMEQADGSPWWAPARR